MPTETSLPWLSPTPKEVVRERVRDRTRALLKQRVLTGATVVVVVALAVSVRATGGESSSRIVTVDNPAPAPRQSVDVPGAPEPGASVPTPSTPGLRSAGAPLGGPLDRDSRAGTSDSGQVPALPDTWDLADPLGDARYDARCSLDACPEETNNGISKESQPALDLLGINVVCSATTVRVTFNVLDPEAPVSPGQFGAKAMRAYYTASFKFDEEKSLVVVLNHDLAPDSWRASVLVPDGPSADVPLRVGRSSLEFEFSPDFFGWHPAEQGKAQLWGTTSVIFEGAEAFTSTTFADDWNTPEDSVDLCRS